MVVLHYTGMQGAQDALQRLCDPSAEVSAHYMIAPCGRVWQMVADDQRAWHAGAGAWNGSGDINSRSIGIELVNSGAHPFPEPQMRVLEALLQDVMTRWAIAPVNVIAHSDMAPARKEDPGPKFDWQRLARQGLALWPEGAGPPAPFDTSLTAIGYPDAPADKRLQAFRFRFRPWGAGPQCAQDESRASYVAAAFRAARAQL